MTLNNFFSQVLEMPYEMNRYGDSQHEQRVAELLTDNGFTVVGNRTKKQYKKEYGNDFENLPEGVFLSQPNGNNASPDFLGKVNGKIVQLECKSSKQGHPTYNGGLPKKGVVYIFSSARYNGTTVFFAEDVVSDAKRQMYARLVEEIDALVESYQLDEEWSNDDRGFDFYPRAMYTQSGGASKTDYFTHTQRNFCEQRVLNHNW